MKTLGAFLIVAFVVMSFLFWGFFNDVLRFDKKEHVAVRLAGYWRFTPGDKLEYSDPEFNDKDWSKVRVPGQWESQGFRNYDGYSWYRTKFKIKPKYLNSNLYLHLGYIDDVDEVYFNGINIGQSGSFPPYYETAYDQKRVYKLPNQHLKEGENILAIRVFDQYGPGGILSGNIEIIESEFYEPEIKFESMWKFSVGDDLAWCSKDFDDRAWETIKVPASWESQGHKDYDGYAWYRTSFKMNRDALDEQYVIMLGKIDDINEVYLNGRIIGNHGDFKNHPEERQSTGYYNVFRGYFVPRGYLTEGKNILAVRVYDYRSTGGIYEGPVGLTTQDMYTNKWKSKNRNNM